jgi:hypothetical protein
MSVIFECDCFWMSACLACGEHAQPHCQAGSCLWAALAGCRQPLLKVHQLLLHMTFLLPLSCCCHSCSVISSAAAVAAIAAAIAAAAAAAAAFPAVTVVGALKQVPPRSR